MSELHVAAIGFWVKQYKCIRLVHFHFYMHENSNKLCENFTGQAGKSWIGVRISQETEGSGGQEGSCVTGFKCCV